MGRAGPHRPALPAHLLQRHPDRGLQHGRGDPKYKAKGVPASKLNLGIGFYGRGWTGVTQDAPGGTATGPAPGTYEQGIEDYKVLKTSCPVTGTDRGHGLRPLRQQLVELRHAVDDHRKDDATRRTRACGGAFFWEFSGDTANGELLSAMASGLN